ncbi:Topless-related protein 2 [Hibiscus syriacus]|uniref:Topless-related protein 2 n=1 Tax=Hibiscus syriacus TaxID=106335 RepID=A0A6A2Y8B2_HIBSY|nr:Topless-related protein 2 [Hibiscus syriacus]
MGRYTIFGGYLRRQEKVKALEILVTDLRVFSTFNDELYKEISQLLTLNNFRENEQLSKYGDTKTARAIMLVELKKLIEANPLFRDKLAFPTLRNQDFIHGSHMYAPKWSSCTPVNLPIAAVAKPAVNTSLSAHSPFPPPAAANAGTLAGWMANASASTSVQAAVVTASSIPVPQNQVQNFILKRPRTPPTVPSMVDYQNPDLQLMKRLRSAPSIEEVISPPFSFRTFLLVTYPAPWKQAWSLDDLPRTVAFTMHQGSMVTSMDFHPSHYTLLLEELLQALMVNDTPISVSRVTWSPDGSFFIFSTAVNGKIKAWLYDNMGSRVDYDAPGNSCTTMLYSADGSRLFSCGTSKDGESFLVEWNESEGAIKRSYVGFGKKSAGVISFDTTQNHFLAAGEDSQIKFWDMDILIFSLSPMPRSLPRVKFNKEGNLLAVTTADNGFKILANAVGIGSLRATETSTFDPLRTPILSAGIKLFIIQIGIGFSSVFHAYDVLAIAFIVLDCVSPKNGVDPLGRSVEKPRVADDAIDKPKAWQLAEVVDSAQCRLVTLPDSTEASSKVVRLLYTNSAVGILALGSNGVQKLWNLLNFKATTNVAPQHWQPNSGLLMTNDITGVNLEEAVPCIALSKNDSYVMSATGGKVSLFNTMTFKVKSKLKGHQKRRTGLAISTNLGILVSSGADAHLCVWSIDTWEKRKSVAIQMPAGKAPTGDTRVQFHSDQIRMLWIPQDVLPASISCATYSCNSQSVYATFCDGNIGVFDADSLKLRCRIASSVYLSPTILKGNQAVYPLVVAAHPMEPNQFAIGLSDVTVKVMEPSESEGKWGVSPPADNGVSNGRATSSSTTSNHTPDQLQRRGTSFSYSIVKVSVLYQM